MAMEALALAKKKDKAHRAVIQYEPYQRDPVKFGTDILGEYFTDGIIEVMNSVRDHSVTIAKSANDVGKTHAAARIALWFYKCFPGSQVYTTAAPPLDNLRRLLWGEILTTVEKHKDIFPFDRMRSLHISMGARHFITGVAIPASGTSEEREAKFSGKHAPFLLFIVDEGDAVPEEVYKGIESCMSGGMARLLVMFNPRAQRGPVYDKERSGEANIVELSAFDHPNVITGEDIIPGAVTRETTVRRIHQWTRTLAESEKPDSDCFVIPDFLVGSIAPSQDGTNYAPLEEGWRKIIESSFSYMVMGVYPVQSETQLINRVWIEDARKRYDKYLGEYGDIPPEGIRPVMGMDIAEFGSDSNAACLRYGFYVPKLKLWSGLDTAYTSQMGIQTYVNNNVEMAFIDGTGVGAGIGPFMARDGRKDNVRVVSIKASSKPMAFIKSEYGEFRILRDQLWWAVREWLRTDPNAMLPPDPLLVEELTIPTYRISLTGNIEIMNKDVMRELLKRSPDRADALCLTFVPVYRPTFIRLTNFKSSDAIV
jgi:hypothetical protein